MRRRKAKAVVKSKTILGIAIMALGAALPAIAVELSLMPPSPLIRWLIILCVAVGAPIAYYGRKYANGPLGGVFNDDMR